MDIIYRNPSRFSFYDIIYSLSNRQVLFAAFAAFAAFALVVGIGVRFALPFPFFVLF